MLNCPISILFRWYWSISFEVNRSCTGGDVCDVSEQQNQYLSYFLSLSYKFILSSSYFPSWMLFTMVLFFLLLSFWWWLWRGATGTFGEPSLVSLQWGFIASRWTPTHLSTSLRNTRHSSVNSNTYESFYFYLSGGQSKNLRNPKRESSNKT